MTAKQFVLERYPKAWIHFYHVGRFSINNQRTRSIVVLDNEEISRDEKQYSDSNNQAWQNAKAKIEEMEKGK